MSSFLNKDSLAMKSWVRVGLVLVALSTGAAGVSAAETAPAAPAGAEQPFSPAETRLFVTEHLKNLPARESVLNYKFIKSGAYEAGYEDKVVLQIGAPDAKTEGGRTIKTEFMTGDHKADMPPVEGAHGNPVIMYFLERDVREMKRITGGSCLR